MRRNKGKGEAPKKKEKKRFGFFKRGKGAPKSGGAAAAADASSVMPASVHWQTLPPLPEPRYGAKAFVSAGALFLVGGVTPSGDFADSILAMDVDTLEWRRMDATFEPKQFHSLVVDENTWKAYTFGGKANGYRNDVWSFDMADQEWEAVQPASQVKPSPRYGHAAVVFDGKMWVVGGFENQFSGPCNEVWTFTFATRTWEEVKTQGTKPQSRFNHSANIVWLAEGPNIIIFGGCGADNNALNDIHRFDLQEHTWHAIPQHGTPVQPRFGHCAWVVGTELVVMGGNPRTKEKVPSNAIQAQHLIGFNMGTHMWTTVRTEGEGPGERCFASTATVANRIYMLGGRTVASEQVLAEAYCLDLQFCFIDLLPKPVLLYIFSMLPMRSIASMASMSRRFYKLATSDEVWKPYLDSFAPPSGLPESLCEGKSNYAIVLTNFLLTPLPPAADPSCLWRNPVVWGFGNVGSLKVMDTSSWPHY